MNIKKRFLSLPGKLLFYKIAVLFLLIGVSVTAYKYWDLKRQYDVLTGDLPDYSYDPKNIPHYKEIMGIIRPLDYSIVPTFMLQTDITLSLDFTKKTWTLHKFHQYEPNGDIILDYGRYGLCGELASYTYDRIKPLLGSRFIIKFANVAQAGFFNIPGDTHVVLVAYDQLHPEGYLIDPSFHRYGPVTSYKDYLFSSFADRLDWVDKRQTDVSFSLNQAMPVLIHNDLISYLSVRDSDGKFDKDNFIISVFSVRRYKYAGDQIFYIQKQAGRTNFYENKEFENKAMTSEDIKVLKKTLTAWFYSLEN